MCILIHTEIINPINTALPDKSFTASILWDRFGIGVSAICAIHCLFFPAIISLLPIWSFLPGLHEWAHPVFVLLILPIVYFAARRSHFDFAITTILVFGFICVLAGWLLGHYWLGFIFEISMTLFGSGLLIAGHWFNYRHHRTCTNHNHKHHVIEEENEVTNEAA